MSFQTKLHGRSFGLREIRLGRATSGRHGESEKDFLVGEATADFASYLVESEPRGFLATGSFDALDADRLSNAGLEGCDGLPRDAIAVGDIVSIAPSGLVRVLHRATALHNSILLTERCNSWCIMCSQPPRPSDAAGVVEEACALVDLLPETTRSIGLTGGEPLLLGNELLALLERLRDRLPSTAVSLLTNGRLLSVSDFAKDMATVGHPNLRLCIPLYSDIDSTHDFVVGAKGAFGETVRGIVRAGAEGLSVEIRVVVQRATVPRLARLAEFICRNLNFVDHVALMGLEPIGFGRTNLDELWIDPADCQNELRRAIAVLARARVPVSLYNFPLCVLDPGLRPFARKSISDWKNDFPEVCSSCAVREDCCGLFQSALNSPWTSVLSPVVVDSGISTSSAAS